MKPEAWPWRFLHSCYPLPSAHITASACWRISAFQHHHFYECPVFTAQSQGGEITTAKLQSRFPSSLRSECPPSRGRPWTQELGVPTPWHSRISTYNFWLPPDDSPLVSTGIRFQDPLWKPNCTDAQVPRIKRYRATHTVSPSHLRIPNHREKILFLIHDWLVQRVNCTHTEKKSAYKWTSAIQTCVVRGSTVLLQVALAQFSQCRAGGASGWYHTSPRQARPRGFWKGLCSKAFLTCCRMCLSLSVISLLWSSTSSSRYAWKRRVPPKNKHVRKQFQLKRINKCEHTVFPWK